MDAIYKDRLKRQQARQKERFFLFHLFYLCPCPETDPLLKVTGKNTFLFVLALLDTDHGV